MNIETRMNIETNMKSANRVKSVWLSSLVAVVLLKGISAQAQGQILADHLYAGAVGTVYGDQLVWANADAFATNAGYYRMDYSTGGSWAGYYNSEPTMTVLAATAAFGGPVPKAPALGSFIQAKIFLVGAPEGGQFGFWEAGATNPTYILNTGDSSQLIPLSGGDENAFAGTFGEDPYGHIEDRRFTATALGDYIVGFQLFDTSDNGLDGLPIHSPSDILYVNFRAVLAPVPEPTTTAMISLGLGTLWLGTVKRMRFAKSGSSASAGQQSES